MQNISEAIKVLDRDFQNLKNSISIGAKEVRLKELESTSIDPDLWSNREKARSVMQELSDIKEELTEIDALTSEIEILKEIQDASSIGSIEKRIKKLILKTYLSNANDAKNAILSLHAGQGGVEAMDWAAMLMRMYLRFCERRGWRTSVLDETRGEEAGVKSAVIRVEGAYAYGYLKGEAGTHRLVRQSPFNADKLRQTSFALVEVLPDFGEVELPDIDIRNEDLQWQFFRAGSQGGQNVNKVSTAVRLKHIASGIVVTAQSERFQEQNRKNAMNILRAKLWARAQEEAQETKKDIKGEYKPASWGTQIRSYVLHPYKMVKDLRTGVETSNTESVLDGEIDEFIESELKLTKN